MKFKKKPIIIEAVQYLGTEESYKEINEFISDLKIPVGVRRDKVLTIRTLEGEMEANPGDWIIKGVAGEFYPCKTEIFKKTYEEVWLTKKQGEDKEKEWK